MEKIGNHGGMKKQLLGLFSTIVPALVIFALPASAFAYVTAMPSYYDFGSVPAGRSGMTTIQFMNNSPRPVQFFNVNCSGDFAAFSCFSFCSYLPAYGVCNVQVRFQPRSGDGQRRMIWINGSGSGEFATATVYGTDAKTGN
jgi:hypothetical protein